VQFNPEASSWPVAPDGHVPRLPFVGADRLHERCSTGAIVVKFPAPQVRCSVPLVRVHPANATYVHDCPLVSTAPAVHPPLVPAGTLAGIVHGSGEHTGWLPDHAAAKQLCRPPLPRE